MTRSYDGFWAAADEQARSRVYGGIHFSFDSVAGQEIGGNVADYVMDNFLEPERRGRGRDGDNRGHHREDRDRGPGRSNVFFDDRGRDSFFGDRDENDLGGNRRSLLR